MEQIFDYYSQLQVDGTTYVKYTEFSEGRQPIFDVTTGVALICTQIILYLIIIGFIFIKRKEYPIYNRSPKLIMLGALGKHLFTPIYFFRALRIYKVLSYYEGYWLLMKHYGEESEVRMSNYLTKEENAMLQKSKQWRENSLIAFMIFNLMIPLIILSLISFLVPYIYTIIPVYDTDTCWTYFIQQEKIKNIPETPCQMQTANLIVFVVLNWFEIAGYAIAFWMVRNIKNELNIKVEIYFIIIFWTLFSIFYFSMNIYLQYLHSQPSFDKDMDKTVRLMIYISIILRNFTTLCATTMFSIYTLIRHPERAYPRNIEGKLEALDFDLVLNSSLPFQYFFDFVVQFQPHYKPYFDVYVLAMLYQEQIEDLMNDEKSNSKIKINHVELDKQKQNLLDIITCYQLTHFNFEPRHEISMPRFNNDVSSLQQSVLSSDVKSFLPQFQYRSDRISKQIEGVDFTICLNKSRNELRLCYERQFKKHPKFLELIGQLIQNEIEQKFLEHAEVIRQ
eukprot:403346954